MPARPGPERSMPAAVWRMLQAEAAVAAQAMPALAPGLACTALAASPAEALAGLLGATTRPVWIDAATTHRLAAEILADGTEAQAAAFVDLDAITRLNFEPGGLLATWIGGRGFHMLTAHRVAHGLWVRGDHALAMAMKTAFAALGADIHPAARFGRGIFLDHGIGLVIGETAVVEADVCLWHGVTLGSTLMESGDRHPKIRRGAVLGAGATILGNIEVGAGAVVAAGAVVLAPVPPHTTVAGNPARPKSVHRHPHAQPEPPP